MMWTMMDVVDGMDELGFCGGFSEFLVVGVGPWLRGKMLSVRLGKAGIEIGLSISPSGIFKST